MRKYKYTKEILENAVSLAFSIAELCRVLNIRPSGGNYRTLKIYLQKFGVSTEHFTGQSWHKGRKYAKYSKSVPLELVLVENYNYSSDRLKKRLVEEGIKEWKCEKCKLSEWNDEVIPLELDHVNGNNLDNRLENLQILCPNCHAQTPTFRGKNASSFKHELRKDNYNNKEIKFPLTSEIMKYKKNNAKLLCECGEEKSRNALKCKTCDSKVRMSISKIEWPTTEELQHKVENSSYVQVGKELGVSDNAVRKHLQKRLKN